MPDASACQPVVSVIAGPASVQVPLLYLYCTLKSRGEPLLLPRISAENVMEEYPVVVMFSNTKHLISAPLVQFVEDAHLVEVPALLNAIVASAFTKVIRFEEFIAIPPSAVALSGLLGKFHSTKVTCPETPNAPDTKTRASMKFFNEPEKPKEP